MVLPFIGAIAGFLGISTTTLSVIAVVGSIAYQQNKVAKAKRAAEARADASRGFEIALEGEPLDLPIVYGRAIVGGGITDANVSGNYVYAAESDTSNIISTGSLSASENAGKNTYLNVQRALAQSGGTHDGITRIAEILVDGRSYSSPDIEGYGFRSTLDKRGGRAMTIAGSNGFGANNRFYNAVYTTETFKLNRKDRQYNGFPSLQYLVDGMEIRDLVLNNNVAEISTSRSFSNNPARILLDYLTASYGANLSDDQLDIQSFYDASEICKVRRLTAVSGGGEFFSQTISSGSMYWPKTGSSDTKRSYPDDHWTGSMPTSDFDTGRTYTVIAPDSGQPATFLGSDCINVVSSGGTTTFRINLSNVTATVSLKFGSSYRRASWRDNTFGPIYQDVSITNVDTCECNLSLDPSAPIRDNVERILDTMVDSDLIWSDGIYKLVFNFPQNQTEQDDLIDSNHNFTDDHLIGSIEEVFLSDDQRLNQATVRFRNEFNEFARDSVSWPPFSNDSNSAYQTYLSEDNDIPHRSSYTYEGITNPYIAEQRAETLVRKSRFEVGYTFSVTPKAYTVEPGDLITVYSETANIGTSSSPIVMRVTSIQQQQDYSFRIEAVEFDYNNLGWNVVDTDDYAFEPRSYGQLNIQDPEEVTFTQTGNDLQNTSGYVTWLPDEVDNNSYSFRIYYSTESSPDVDTLTDWEFLGESSALETGTDPDDNSIYEYGKFDAPVLKDGTYTFAVQATSANGQVSNLVSTSTTTTIVNRRPTVMNVQRTGSRPNSVPAPTTSDLDAPAVVGDIVSITYADGEGGTDTDIIIPTTYRWNGTQWVAEEGKFLSGDSISAGTIRGSSFTTANTSNAISFDVNDGTFTFSGDNDGVLATSDGGFIAGRIDPDSLDFENTSYIAHRPPTDDDTFGLTQFAGQIEWVASVNVDPNDSNENVTYGVAFNRANDALERSAGGKILATGFDSAYDSANDAYDNNNTNAFTNTGNIHFTVDSANRSISANGSSGGGHGNYSGNVNINVDNTNGVIAQDNSVTHSGNLNVAGNATITGNISTATANVTGGVRVDPANTNINISANGLIDGNAAGVSNIVATDGDGTVGIAGNNGNGFNVATSGSTLSVNADNTNQVVTLTSNATANTGNVNNSDDVTFTNLVVNDDATLGSSSADNLTILAETEFDHNVVINQDLTVYDDFVLGGSNTYAAATYSMTARDTSGFVDTAAWDLRDGTASSAASITFSTWADWANEFVRWDPTEFASEASIEALAGETVTFTFDASNTATFNVVDAIASGTDFVFELGTATSTTGVPSTSGALDIITPEVSVSYPGASFTSNTGNWNIGAAQAAGIDLANNDLSNNNNITTVTDLATNTSVSAVSVNIESSTGNDLVYAVGNTNILSVNQSGNTITLATNATANTGNVNTADLPDGQITFTGDVTGNFTPGTASQNVSLSLSDGVVNLDKIAIQELDIVYDVHYDDGDSNTPAAGEIWLGTSATNRLADGGAWTTVTHIIISETDSSATPVDIAGILDLFTDDESHIGIYQAGGQAIFKVTGTTDNGSYRTLTVDGANALHVVGTHTQNVNDMRVTLQPYTDQVVSGDIVVTGDLSANSANFSGDITASSFNGGNITGATFANDDVVRQLYDADNFGFDFANAHQVHEGFVATNTGFTFQGHLSASGNEADPQYNPQDTNMLYSIPYDTTNSDHGYFEMEVGRGHFQIQGTTSDNNDNVDQGIWLFDGATGEFSANGGNIVATRAESNAFANTGNVTFTTSANGVTSANAPAQNDHTDDIEVSVDGTNDVATITTTNDNSGITITAEDNITIGGTGNNMNIGTNATNNVGNVSNIIATDGSGTVGIAGDDGDGFNIAVGSNMSVNADNTNQVVTINANDADTTYTGTGLISISNNQVISTNATANTGNSNLAIGNTSNDAVNNTAIANFITANASINGTAGGLDSGAVNTSGVLDLSSNGVLSSNATANTGNVNNATAVNFTTITGNGAFDVNTNANIGSNAANHTLTVTGNLDVNGTTANIGNLAINSGGTNTNLNSNAGSISLNDSVITNFSVTAEGNQAWTIPATLATGIDLTNNSNIPSGDATGWDVGDITQNATNLDINAGSGAVSNASGQSLLIGGVDEFIRYDDANSNLEFFGHVFGPIDEANFRSTDFQAVTASSATFAPAQTGEYLFALVGAGGGGSAASGVSNNRESHAFACGGGAGGFAAFRHTINDITNQSYAITLGSGGDLNVNSNNHRNSRGAFSAPAGGSSSITFNDGTNTVNLVTVNGGGGGNANNDQTGTGGAGGTATANNANGGISDVITRTGGSGGEIGGFSGGMSGGGAPDIFGNNADVRFCSPANGASSGASCFGSQAVGDTRSGNNNGHFCTLPSTINANGGTYIMGRNGPTVSFSGDGGSANGDYFGEYGPGSYGGITSGGAISAAASSGFVGGTAAIYSDVDGQTGPVAGNSIFGGGGAAGVTSNAGTNNGSLTGGNAGSSMFGGGGGGMAIGGAALSNSLPGAGGDAVMYYVRIGTRP